MYQKGIKWTEVKTIEFSYWDFSIILIIEKNAIECVKLGLISKLI